MDDIHISQFGTTLCGKDQANLQHVDRADATQATCKECVAACVQRDSKMYRSAAPGSIGKVKASVTDVGGNTIFELALSASEYAFQVETQNTDLVDGVETIRFQLTARRHRS